MTSPRRIRTRALVDWSSLADASGNRPVIGVNADGSLAACVRKSAESPTIERGLGIFPKSRLNAPTDYHAVTWKDGRSRELVIRGEPLEAHHVLALPEGILLASARCHWRPEGAERNAAVYDWDGNLKNRLCLGDGIQGIRTAPDGGIWVSYFDEGVFGNYGWGHPGPEPIGSCGLVAFDSKGEVRFRYSPESAGTDAICDAYACTIASDGAVWVCFYTDFPLVRIHGGTYRTWTPGIAGCGAVAIRDGRALMYGDYDRRTRGTIVRLGADGSSRVEGEVEFDDPQGRPLDQPWGAGVGETLYLVDGGRIYSAQDW